ncbi:MAG: hypothetical protein AUJ92_19575 [Armatimonadetes bacterium CG2_30_59_28]|nr:hypothetical protein [Armatimonadota bacterium]OIO90102.1 MAG: hypothetical protein AUJ92_19575 [Armatimonadetes bacterium CG2_30_59_28]PIU67096.1 MAG: hypothetical protein COS85_02055 [Armatimonadetes bacterium CG07_land_8_20_14_0_80_59_28]PIY44052.1 MAG: hypothetical protein COZ05_09315 [Armatimonadetes bacterium CG_4_10_14_3_um_filter_59_10]PJB63363.1 MAG: hypothetical protein CO095_16635 [Armatimonadetes bacterium CG_4_9_14_3_um_filter_58_7]
MLHSLPVQLKRESRTRSLLRYHHLQLFDSVFACRMRVPPFIITVGTLSIARGIATLLTRGNPITDLPEQFLRLDEWDCAGYIQVSTIVLILLAVAAAVMMSNTVLGRHPYAVGGNLEGARLSGVKIDFVMTFCYVAATVLAGIVGILNAGFIAGGRPGVCACRRDIVIL